ncbi:hypothetical protein V9L05_17820 [Bernardetia sp. Wsw4-3y2]|uniref:hypothetical protein n=1 Tax=Bernardetia sp. Wsw4-3y2 TaxID=3127471 RepID=UPI0030D1FE92
MDKNKTTRPYAIQIIGNGIPQIKNFDTKYAYIPFRLLSADSIIGAGGWNCSFFPKKVLQEAAQMWEGQVLRVDHSLSTKNIIGNIVEVWFDEGFIQDGVTIPAGVNGFFRVSREEFSKEVELLTSDPAGIRATSAGVQFEFKYSHEFDEEWESWYNIGNIINGEFCHFIVTKITEVIEQSAVWDGADPCAVMLGMEGDDVVFKYLKENRILNEARMDELKTKTENKSQFKTEFKKEYPKGVAKLAKLTFGNPNKPLDDTFGEGLGKTFDDHEKELKNVIGKSKKEETKTEPQEEEKSDTSQEKFQEELKAKESKILQLQISLEEEKNEVVKLTTQLEVANKKLKASEEFATLSKSLLEKKRNYTKEVYAKQGKELSANIENIIMKADFDTLDDLITTFGGKAMTIYGEPKCSACGGKDFTIRNSQHSDLPDEHKAEKANSNDALDNFYLTQNLK